jgi:carboxymethylenebutenolidase
MKGIFMAVLVWACAAGAQDSVRVRLNESPRHQEWVKVKSGERQVHAFLVFPEVADPALAVVVIHENRGLTDWVRSVADHLAEAGYIAIAPDLLSGMGPEGGGTDAFPSSDEARQALYQLMPEQIEADLNGVVEYVKNLPACSGKVVVGGFCWGGGQTFAFAAQRADLNAAFVFYGRGPEAEEAVARIACPVYGFYGGQDERINAAIPQIAGWMEKAGKVYEPVIYEGAGHGFMRSGEGTGAGAADQKARALGWSRWLGLLEKR